MGKFLQSQVTISSSTSSNDLCYERT